MDVIHAAGEIFIVVDGVFPITALPDATFAFLHAACADFFTTRNMAGKMLLDKHDAFRIVIIFFRQGNQHVHVIGQYHNGFKDKGMSGFDVTQGFTEQGNMTGQ